MSDFRSNSSACLTTIRPGTQLKRFFFEKRTKKLLLLWHTLPDKPRQRLQIGGDMATTSCMVRSFLDAPEGTPFDFLRAPADALIERDLPTR
jgi:hypothetical protein